MLELLWSYTQIMFLYSRYRIRGAVGFDFRDLVPNNSSEMFSSIKTHLFHWSCYRSKHGQKGRDWRRRPQELNSLFSQCNLPFLLKTLKVPLTKWRVCPPWSDSTCTSWIPLWEKKRGTGLLLITMVEGFMKKVSPTKRSFRWVRHIPLPRPVQDLLWEHCPINGRISGLFWTAFLNPCMRKIFQSVKGQLVINPKKFYYVTFITPRRCD